jgi:hypothetical protein
LPYNFSPKEMMYIMPRATKRGQIRFEIEKNTSLDNRIFTGCLYDSELNVDSKGYLFEYFLHVKHYSVNGTRCIIEDAIICVTARADENLKPNDLYKEISELKKEAKRYQSLAQTKPNDIAEDGLTNAEIAKAYCETLTLLEGIKGPLLDHIKIQIKDRLNTDESTVCKDIDIAKVRQVTCSKAKMQPEIVRWKRT